MPGNQLPKYQVIARAIEERLGDLDGQGKLPTVRGIAEEFHVSIVTASRALQVLRDKGLVHTIERSGCFLAPAAPAVTECWALIQNLTANPWRQAAIAMMLEPFQSIAEQSGFTLYTDFPQFRPSISESELQHHIQEAIAKRVGGVFFVPSRVSEAAAAQDEKLIEAFRARGIPVILIERNLRGDSRSLSYDLVATDDFEGGHLLTRHLATQGRRRIAFITGSPISTHNQRLAGYLFALHRLGLGAPLILEEPGGLPSKEAYRSLVDQLLSQNADGVICYQDYTAIGIIVEAMTRRILVPKQMAVVGFDNLPIGHSFAVGVTTYAFPAQRIVREALSQMRRRVRDFDSPAIKLVVPGEVIVRESSQLSNEA